VGVIYLSKLIIIIRYKETTILPPTNTALPTPARAGKEALGVRVTVQLRALIVLKTIA
jgi:hypothetical protein